MGQPHIVAQWADAHNSLAQAWVTADPTHGQYVDDWAKKHVSVVQQWIKNPLKNNLPTFLAATCSSIPRGMDQDAG
jgi:potassium-transporting ATPase KdpC subunit